MENALRLRAAEPSFTAGSIIGRTFSVWASNLIAFSAVFLTLHIPNLVLTLVQGPPTVGVPPSREVVLLAVGNGVLSAVMSLAATGALTYGVLQSYSGAPRGAGSLIGFGLRKIWPVFVVSLDAGIRIALFTLLLLIPGLIASCRYFVAVPSRVAEPKLRSHQAVARSSALTKDHLWPIFVVMLVFWIVGAAASMLLQLVGVRAGLLSFPVIATVTWVLTGAVNSLWATAAGVAYHDLRVEKEGVDTAQLAAVFD